MLSLLFFMYVVLFEYLHTFLCMLCCKLKCCALSGKPAIHESNLHSVIGYYVLGAVMGGPARDEVMKKIPGRQGHPGPHPWRGHEERTWQARPSRIRDPPVWPQPLPHPVSSPLFLLLFLFALLQILVLPADSSPAPLSLNEDQLKTLINKYPGCWYPMKGPRMKEMLQFKPFCWHSGLFDKCVLPLQKMLMIVLNILSTVR